MNSFSQGIFCFQNGIQNNIAKQPKKTSRNRLAKTTFDFDASSHLWNSEFDRTWNLLKVGVDEYQENNNDSHLADLFEFVTINQNPNENVHKNDSTAQYLRVATLLTGINKPDHFQYFKLLASRMQKQKIAQTIFLPARDCPTARAAIETLVSCVLNRGRKHKYQDDIAMNTSHDDSDTDECNESAVMESDDEPPIKLRRSQYTMQVLQSWYDEQFELRHEKQQLAIIIPNFEEFKGSVIKDLISILSNYCARIPFTIIIGVATTTNALLNTLSYTETTRMKIRAFSAQPPNRILEQMLDQIILTPKWSFQLASNVFEYLKGVFIFYDLTTKNFLKAIHFSLLQHYSQGNAYALCATSFAQAKKTIAKLKSADLNEIRRLRSFRPYVESMTDYKAVIDILKDDNYLRQHLVTMIRNVYRYLAKFYGYIRFVWQLVKDLPGAPLGKRLSDVYVLCQSSQKNLTASEDFQKCWKLLGMMTHDEFNDILANACAALKTYEETYVDDPDNKIDEEISGDARSAFAKTVNDIERLTNELQQDDANDANESMAVSNSQKVGESRSMYYREIMEMNKQTRTNVKRITKILDYIREEIIEMFVPGQNGAPPLLELFVYSDYEHIRSHLRGTARSAIHTALTNPKSYLQCDCCELGYPGQLLPSMPDLSVAYKLLLESGQQVNIYDWLVAFSSIVGIKNDDDKDDDGNVPQDIQARFTRARAELQFIGFTKASKRKTDHITKTTW